MRRPGFLASSLFSLCLLAGPLSSASAQTSKTLQQEEGQDYYQKWLNEDVVYIITDDERAVFRQLTTNEERESFIEQFWARRDPDPKTVINEAKEEHYRRIAYANERFGSGKAGWRSDQGRIYITHGEPDEIQEHFGGPYSRPLYEGGGQTSVFPYQTWRYRYIEGLGNDIELEFVDTTMTGDYHLASDPFEKDAFSNVPGIGLTEAEEKGLATKHDRFIRRGGSDYYPLLALRNQDTAFARLERYAGVMRPPKLKYNDLKQIVDVNVSYNSLPFRFHQSSFRLNQDQCIVPITLELANRNLTYKEENGRQVAKIAVYGTVIGLGKGVLKEFEDEIASSFSNDRVTAGLQGRSYYQKTLVLERGRRVKLNLVVKDLHSGKLGTMVRAIVPPSYSPRDLELSSLVLTDTIQPLDRPMESDEMFVLGDLKIRPSLDRLFNTSKLMASYIQVYNAGIDQQTLQPALQVTYKLFKDGKELATIVDKQGESMRSFSGQRIILTRRFSPKDLGPGRYRMMIEVKDLIGNQSATTSDDFQVVARGTS